MTRPADHLPPPPPSLDRARNAELTALTKHVLQRQRRQLAQATDRALEHIPRPLRGAVRRALGA
ncbi:MAG TPA: hypothetical protein VII01_05955 [Solirubrobacteraceae bacterium]|jgi:hypothetical protein